MIDGCGRPIDHLRLSLTDRCNLACRYCVPEGVHPPQQHLDARLAYELVAWLAREHGIRHLRLTGGEPLLYPGLTPLIARLATVPELHEITLTTNGQALAHQAQALRAAGLSRLNVSLDTLKADRFAQLTRGGQLEHTVAGIRAAVECGLTPIKLNMVVQRGLNEDELADVALWGLSLGCVVRFLEVMPIGPYAHVVDRHLVPASEIVDSLSRHFALRPIPRPLGQPSIDYAASAGDLRGVIGVIAPTTQPFCDRCRRIRITARAAVVPCVHDGRSYDLSCAWDGDSLETRRADAVLREAVAKKPAQGSRSQGLTMLALGG